MLRLVADAARQRAGKDRNAKEDKQRQKLMRLGYGKGVDRLDEEEIIGQERGQRRHDSGSGAKPHGAIKHGGQKNHRQVRQAQPDGQPLANRDSAGDGSDRRDKFGPEAFWPQEIGTQRRCNRVGGHDVDFNARRQPHQFIGQGAPEQALPISGMGPADEDLRDILAPGQLNDLRGKVAAPELRHLPAQPFGQLQGLHDAPGVGAQSVLPRPLHVDRDPGGIQPGCELAGAPHDTFGHAVRADAGQQPLGGAPGSFNGFLPEIIDHLIINAISRSAQGQLAQSGQVARREKILGGAPRRFRHIDLALVEAGDQVFGRYIDQHDVGGILQNRVGNCFAHGDAGDARHNIGQAFKMLDVDGGPDIDARLEQFLHVLPALGMAAVGRVAMGQFIDDEQLWRALQRRIDVEFLKHAAAVVEPPLREDFQALDQRHRFLAPMGLDNADDDIDPVGFQPLRALQHGKSLADTGCCAQEHLELAALVMLRQRQKSVGVGASVLLSARFCHGRATSARLRI